MDLYPSSLEDKLGFGALRERLDALTLSRLGQDRLAEMRPIADLDRLRAELGRVNELQQSLQFDDPVPFDHVLDIRDVLRRARPEEAYVMPEDLAALRFALGTLRRLKKYFESRRSKYVRLAETAGRITPLPDLEERIDEVVDPEGGVRDHASPELRRLRQLILRRQAQLRETLMSELRRAIADGYATEEQPTIRSGRMVIPVRAEARRKVQGFVQDTSATGQTVYVEPAACLDLNNEVRELETQERREVERILRGVTARVREHLPELQEGVRILAQLDLLQAKARLSNELGAVVPELNEEGIVDIRNGRNPVLLLHFRRLAQEESTGGRGRTGGASPDRAAGAAEAGGGPRDRAAGAAEAGGGPRDVVPLDLALGVDYRTLIITGPNAGGKTVAMKTVGLMSLMLAYGLPLPVDEKSRFCLFGRMMVDIGDEQSIEEDLSTFSSHVANLKYMLRRADGATLILIDEAGTGTDPAEGGALAQAVLEYLTEAGARTIATTHHGTLKVFAYESKGVENGSMEFDQATLSPTYRFRAGVPGSSYAFDIARRIGLDPRLLERARSLVGTQKTALDEIVASFEARSQELERRLTDAREALRQAEHERQRFEGRADKLQREREEIRRQALDEAARIVERANAEVERTIREIKEAQAERDATKEARASLEEFRQQIARRRAKTERRQTRRSERAPAVKAEEPEIEAATGPVRVGDQVVPEGGSTAAEVMEIDGKEAVIAFDSMKMRVRLDRLRKVGGQRRQRVTVREVKHAGQLASFGARSRIDLRGRRVEEALQEVMLFIDEAVAANLSRVEILHGKGTGALRHSIHEYLATRSDVAAFDEAPPDQGGAGVTNVELR